MERVPRRLAIVRANEYVIRHACDYLIAYDRYIATKTHDFVEISTAFAFTVRHSITQHTDANPIHSFLIASLHNNITLLRTHS